MSARVGPEARSAGSDLWARSAGFDLLVHSDWSVSPRGRVCAIAERGGAGDGARQGGGWRVARTRPVGPFEAFLDLLLDPARTVLAGFDFPIGVPRAYAAPSGLPAFPAFLEGLGTGAWSRFFEVCEEADEISVHRPFFPRGRRRGALRAALAAAHGVSGYDALLRVCERGVAGGRRAGASLFFTLGGAQVGRAALSGWAGVVRPAVARGARLWPFEGGLAALAAAGRPVLAETYPAEAYARVGARIGRGGSKRRQADRASVAGTILSHAERAGVSLAPELARDVADGFGARASGEDHFDALSGLLAMIEVVSGRLEEAPADVDRVWEGWILGQAGR